MSQGGPARNLLNLLPLIDSSKYNVTIILFNAGGIFFNEIPSTIKIFYAEPRGLFCNYREDRISYLLWFPVRAALKIIGICMRKFFGQKVEIYWKLKEPFIKHNPMIFDLGMAFIEGAPIYYLSKFINAKIKIGRIPTDYISAKLNAAFDFPYFSKLDYLFSITTETAKRLAIAFPSLKEKIKVFELITSRDAIGKLAEANDKFPDDFSGIRILTLSRIHNTKGTDLIIKACQILKNKKFNFRWYVMGEGSRVEYDGLIKNCGVEDHFFFLKPTNNPFPLLKQADIYVQPSQYEGKSNAINEAKALCKPIIITNFATSSEIITHMKNGLIAEMNESALAFAVQLFVENEKLRIRLSNYWKTSFKSNEEEINKVLGLLNEGKHEN